MDDNKNTNNQNKTLGYLCGAIAFFAGRYLGLIVTLIFIFSMVLGSWFPQWYMKREKINYTLVSFISWSNTLSWLLPPLGIMTGFMAFQLGSYIEAEKTKYKILGGIGVVLSFANAFLGVYMNLQ